MPTRIATAMKHISHLSVSLSILSSPTPPKKSTLSVPSTSTSLLTHPCVNLTLVASLVLPITTSRLRQLFQMVTLPNYSKMTTIPVLNLCSAQSSPQL